jgi:hypothetical protein
MKKVTVIFVIEGYGWDLTGTYRKNVILSVAKDL